MLINANYENFRSLKNKIIFDMTADSICEFKNSVIRWNRNKTDELCVVPLKIIYGQNASGKTNILLGIQVLKEMILKSATHLHFILPYEQLVNMENKQKPITLGISFLHNDKVFDYEVTFTKDEILHEILYVNRSRLFERKKDKIKLAKTHKSMEYFNERRVSTLDTNEKQSIFFSSNSLFLTQGLRSFIAPDLVNEILDFFQNKLHIVLEYPIDMNIPIHIENKVEVDEFIHEMGLQISCDKDIPLSSGSRKLLAITDKVINATKHGEVLIFGNMDDGINATVIMQLLQCLHASQDQNTQVIFDTHNPIYMDKTFIRRDEILLVSNTKDNGTQTKSLLSYASRENNYFRKYVNGEYDTIPVVKFKSS